MTRTRMEWQPIETAPKDGTQIIGFRWPCEDNRKAWPHMCSIAHWDGFNWRWMNGHYLPPTHWMPLPEPPA
jgi:hypothetical protein